MVCRGCPAGRGIRERLAWWSAVESFGECNINAIRRSECLADGFGSFDLGGLGGAGWW